MQILRLTTKCVWGPVLHPSDVDLSLGAPFAQNDSRGGMRAVVSHPPVLHDTIRDIKCDTI